MAMVPQDRDVEEIKKKNGDSVRKALDIGVKAIHDACFGLSFCRSKTMLLFSLRSLANVAC